MSTDSVARRRGVSGSGEGGVGGVGGPCTHIKKALNATAVRKTLEKAAKSATARFPACSVPFHDSASLSQFP